MLHIIINNYMNSLKEYHFLIFFGNIYVVVVVFKGIKESILQYFIKTENN